MLTLGHPIRFIIAAMAERYGVYPTVVKEDVRRVQRKWNQEDAKHSNVRRQRVVRRLDRSARISYSEGDHAGGRDADAKLGRLLGMGAPTFVDRSQHIHLNVGFEGVAALLNNPDAARVLRDALRAVASSEVALPAQVEVKTETNGHAKNGAA